MIYADNAATTKMSAAAISAMLNCMEESWGNPSSLYGLGQRASETLQSARERIAACIGASPKEITFTSGGSEADNQAIRSAALLGARKGKRHIISTAFEHHAVLHTLKKLEDEGFEIELLPVGKLGTVTAQQVADAIRTDTALVTVMYANNEIGSILPVSEIGAVCRERGVLFHTDAVQAAGHLPVDVKTQNIDMLSLSAHKFHGPKGAGVLYARQGVPLTRLIEGGAQERGRRAGTENVAAAAGMAAALEETCAHMEENAFKVSALRERLIAGLSQIPHSALNGDPVNRLPGNVSFCFEGVEGESLLLLLDDRGICASSGSACTSGSLDPSHVLLAIGRPHEVAHGSLRLSLCEENSEADAAAILKAVPEIVAYLRNMSPLWKDKISGKREFVL
ncbi:cysteine desulfurase family protein [Oscillibacter sp. 1-3]|uniref:cysteine desulfurase family protein n=1 Tax=Oscillibacter sp. 1-3 TaxID=1235797 RepID=UPI00033DEC89|nr:IscS subfamily cysteine desulfurase [Oscillibacter sp. 1-3]EOS65336.1 cysteine desulfurase NifS [Oscillibacter sp. 1-3]